MMASLRLEAIGDNAHAAAKEARRTGEGPRPRSWGKSFQPPPPCWCAELIGMSTTYGYERRFLSGKKDYSHGNSCGSRGIYLHYLLEAGHIYEVQAARTWKRIERYFCTVTAAGDIVRLEEAEVQTCLRRQPTSDHSASMC